MESKQSSLLSTVDEPDELAKAYARTAFSLSLFGLLLS